MASRISQMVKEYHTAFNAIAPTEDDETYRNKIIPLRKKLVFSSEKIENETDLANVIVLLSEEIEAGESDLGEKLMTLALEYAQNHLSKTNAVN